MLLLLLTETLMPEPSFSLMLTPTEIESLKKSNQIKLDGLLYHSPDQWVVWINGKRYLPGDIPDEFLIQSVSAEEVVLDVQEEIITLSVTTGKK